MDTNWDLVLPKKSYNHRTTKRPLSPYF